MSHLHTLTLVLGLSAALQAQGTVKISIGVRETEAGGGSFTTIGGNGGTLGGIEWVNKDAQTLVLDGTWQQFTFNITTDPLAAFAGTTANGVLDGTFGVIEHLRVLNDTGITDPFVLWIDDVTATTQTGGPVNFGDFEGYGSGAEVMFQEPSFSGSTSAFLLPGSVSGVDNAVASRTSSCRCDFQFVNNTTTNWVRLTTFNTGFLPNPTIRLDDQCVVTFWMRGGPCQEDVGSQGPGTAYAEMCGAGLSAGQASIYYAAGAQPGVPGVLGISLWGAGDLPIFGGNIVAGLGLAATLPVSADAAGRFQLPVTGSAGVVDLALQSLFFDPTLPQNLAFTNAIRARFGQ
ncbi:MAG: hypothetical protein R3F56_23360 [Planctomycetota bacterium]